MSEAALGLRRSRQEDAEPTRARELDAREPERRLADPSLALQHERGSPTLRPADEGLDRGAVFLPPADDLNGISGVTATGGTRRARVLAVARAARPRNVNTWYRARKPMKPRASRPGSTASSWKHMRLLPTAAAARRSRA